MYTLVLMAAMTTAPDAAQFGGNFLGNLFHGGSSCSGTCSGHSCSGISCSGTCSGHSCSGSSCSGCSGSCQGGHFFGSRLRAFSACHGSCYGSCSGQSNACFGSMASGCCGGGCCGGGMPMMMNYTDGCDSCGTGMPLGVPGPAYDGGMPMMPSSPGITLPGGPLPTAPGIDNPAIPRQAVPPPPSVDTTGRVSSMATGRATVSVRLPADAKLFADGKELNLTSAERSFVTPVLPAGPGFTYTFRVEYTRNGETIAQSKRVAVAAGGSTVVEFADLTTARRPAPPTDAGTAVTSAAKPAGFGWAAPVARPTPAPAPTAPTAADRARITVKLPPGATLFVDDKPSGKAEPVREFNTPPLPPGQEFAYLMKAERMVGGRPEYQIQKVTFRAGEILTVDFTGGLQ